VVSGAGGVIPAHDDETVMNGATPGVVVMIGPAGQACQLAVSKRSSSA
jgi:hypothetical protein